MKLLDLVRDDATGIDAIAEWLDGLGHADRLAETRTLDRAGQRQLYQKAAQGPVISLEHFVPADRAALQPVVHHGRNTLPLPSPWKRFEKRFCRPQAGDGRLFGYNEGSTRSLIGPGYFVAVPTNGNAAWTERGGIVVDYFQVPDGPVAEGWPEVVPNSKGLQMFVFQGTRDFMRRASRHVSIGAAYKGEKALDHYFVLVRED